MTGEEGKRAATRWSISWRLCGNGEGAEHSEADAGELGSRVGASQDGARHIKRRQCTLRGSQREVRLD